MRRRIRIGRSSRRQQHVGLRPADDTGGIIGNFKRSIAPLGDALGHGTPCPYDYLTTTTGRRSLLDPEVTRQ